MLSLRYKIFIKSLSSYPETSHSSPEESFVLSIEKLWRWRSSLKPGTQPCFLYSPWSYIWRECKNVFQRGRENSSVAVGNVFFTLSKYVLLKHLETKFLILKLILYHHSFLLQVFYFLHQSVFNKASVKCWYIKFWNRI